MSIEAPFIDVQRQYLASLAVEEREQQKKAFAELNNLMIRESNIVAVNSAAGHGGDE